MSEFGPDSGGRVKGVTIIKPIVYGNIARYFGKKREEDGHTHQWTVYVKPYKNEDMSIYVKKVHFKLHESYANQNRVVTKPPYEVTETGWGEFEIVIKIYFHDPNERPVTVYHILKLFQSETNIMLGKKHLVSEFYDELIFQDPSAMMQQLLTSTRQLTLGPYKHETDFEEKKEKSLSAILSAKNKIRVEINDMKEKLKIARETISKFKDEISQLEKSQNQNKDKE
ncbi:YEATS domain-containing protein 4-like isoform X1 [Limulus polyphemus]|uniref:YEATS domain-containing protein 4-like isoform X1 n=1 Tax=Limulus polyphemus TaxID=6850 RepID=A0ABM1BC19_LIMPO|nr:YEATS domain-containing protein 4-like isoform X1 [Limulus polyphemus]XP_013778978.1 YEATS domain-containing protein 4-like isoform X1 [Limulus polyphemus]XP_013778979.1 YEATS domain-containing protein 4-like isoform X1 [Limulus polyphemus]